MLAGIRNQIYDNFDGFSERERETIDFRRMDRVNEDESREAELRE